MLLKGDRRHLCQGGSAAFCSSLIRATQCNKAVCLSPKNSVLWYNRLRYWNKPAAMTLASPLQTWTNTPSWNGSRLYFSLWIQKASQLTYTDACANITGSWGYLKPQEFALLGNTKQSCRCVSLFTPTFCRFYFRSCCKTYRSQWPRGLRHGSAAARLLELRVRIPRGAQMSLVNVVCCAGRGLCVGPIHRPENSYRVCVWVCVCLSVCVAFFIIIKQHAPLYSNITCFA